MIAGLLAHRLAAPLMGGALALSLIGNGVLGVKLHAANATVDTLTSETTRLAGDLRTCQGNRRTLEGSIATQNAGVDNLKHAADAAAAGARAGQAAAEVTAAAFDREAAAIGGAVPPPGADRCAAASQLIRSTLRRETPK